MSKSSYIRFDWAIKRLLRQKANFVVLEGFLSVLLNESIKIIEILESESNKTTPDDKFNRVDLLARNRNGELVIIEVQNERELDYFHRILYGVSKAITEYIHERKPTPMSARFIRSASFILSWGRAKTTSIAGAPISGEFLSTTP